MQRTCCSFRVQADKEVFQLVGWLPKQALQGPHLVLLKGLVQVAAGQSDGLDLQEGRALRVIKGITQVLDRQGSWRAACEGSKASAGLA